MKSITTKKWYESANFWTAVVLALGGLFVGFPAEAASNTVANIFVLIGGGMGIREWIKGKPKFSPTEALNRSNWWNYIGTVAVALVPQIPVAVIDEMERAVQAALGGNWQGLIVALFSIATIIYNLLQQRKQEQKIKEAEAQVGPRAEGLTT